jgi:YHS domain-containing protein
MNVDEKTAAATSEHGGQTYYFCAPGCKAAFDKNPGKYLKDEGEQHGMHGMHH